MLSRPWKMCREMQSCLELNPGSGEDVRVMLHGAA